jgi:hypothetical protein
MISAAAGAIRQFALPISVAQWTRSPKAAKAPGRGARRATKIDIFLTSSLAVVTVFRKQEQGRFALPMGAGGARNSARNESEAKPLTTNHPAK